MISVEPGTVVVYTDVVCGWSTIALARFIRERDTAGLSDRLRLDHRLFALEDVNRFPVPKRYLDAELSALGACEPDFGWKPWQEDAATWPCTSLPANEAVHAAKLQSSRLLRNSTWRSGSRSSATAAPSHCITCSSRSPRAAHTSMPRSSPKPRRRHGEGSDDA